jgi:hypothetical protein
LWIIEWCARDDPLKILSHGLRDGPGGQRVRERPARDPWRRPPDREKKAKPQVASGVSAKGIGPLAFPASTDRASHLAQRTSS